MSQTLKILISWIVTLSLFCQTSFAQGPSGEPTAAQKAQWTQGYVQTLQHGLKFKDVFAGQKVKTPADKQLLAEILSTYGNQKIPVPSVQGNVLTFTHENQKLQIEFLDIYQEKIKINGYTADFSGKKTLAERISYAERILNSRPVSSSFLLKHPWLYLLAPEESQAALGYLALIAVGAVAVGAYVYFKTPNPLEDLEKNIQVTLRDCKRMSGGAEVQAQFSCKMDEMKLSSGDEVCLPTQTFAKALQTCCSKKGESECKKKFDSVIQSSNSGSGASSSGNSAQGTK